MRWAVVIALVVAAPHVGAAEPASPRERISLNDGWRFSKGDPAGIGDKLDYATIQYWVLPGAGEYQNFPAVGRARGIAPGTGLACTESNFDDGSWRQVNLPHDWGIEGPFDQDLPGETGKLPWMGVGWYRKTFDVPASDQGREIDLEIDGAMSYAVVWCNGKFVGGWPYGYASWRVHLAPYIKPGEKNTLAIRLDNPNESSRWYPGGGIYRNVWLTKTSPVHVAQWGTFVTTPQVTDASASVAMKVFVINRSRTDAPVTVKTVAYRQDQNGAAVGDAVATFAPATVTVGAGSTQWIENTQTIDHPQLWDCDLPNMYVAITTVEQDGKTIDRYSSPFGIRATQFTANDGFHLNGKRVVIKGVCLHHDLGALGAAFNVRAAQRQLEIMKDMGANAIRFSHNPPAPEMLDLCDRMGFLVWDELADTWMMPKKPKGYALLFADWAEADLRAMIRRDRNHPSVVIWGIGNEIREQRSLVMHSLAEKLTSIVHEEDRSRPSAVACDIPASGYNGFQKTVDLFGYNYKPSEYAKFHKANPEQPLIGSETASTISSRGEYVFPVSERKSDGKTGFQMSSYDLYAPPWAWPPDVEFRGLDQNPFVAGEFVWTGFDYIGEPTPYNSDTTILSNLHTAEEVAKAQAELKAIGKIRVPSRSSYFGIVDLAGFKKDRFYSYQAHWRPELKMAHILPHWNWPDRAGQVTPVHVYASGDEAELFLNGQSLGRKKKGEFEYRLRWDDVKYAPGELKVVAYKNGAEWATDTVKTTGPAARLLLSADRSKITADGRDLSFITATVADENGLLVPRSKPKLKFTIKGAGHLVATDNGDATDHTTFASSERHAFNGLALAIVRGKTGKPGAIQVTVTADNLAPATVEIQTTIAP